MGLQTEADGIHYGTNFYQRCALRVLLDAPSRMKGTLNPTVNTQRIKLRTSSSERRALTATPAPIMNSSRLILPATVPIAKKFKATRLLQK